MKARVERDILADALKHVTSVAKKSYLPVTSAVSVVASDGFLLLSCTDIDVLAEMSVPADVMDVGTIIIEAKPLASFVASGSSPTVEIQEDDQQVEVGCGRARLTTPTIGEDNWPRFETKVDGTSFQVDPGQLERVVYAASTDLTRPALTGVMFGDDHAATTDSYRLAAMPGFEGIEAIVPAAPLAAAVKAGDPFTLTFGERTFAIASGPRKWTGRLIEDDAPAWQRLIREKSTHTLTVDRTALLDAIRVIGAIGDQDTHRVGLWRCDDRLEVFRKDDARKVSDEIACGGTFEGAVCFNARYLDDLLDHVSDDEIRFDCEDHLKPWQVTCDDVVHLLMPIRTEWTQ